LELQIEEASAKIRTGGPSDDGEDYSLDIWAGEIPFQVQTLPAVSDVKLKEGIEIPKSVTDYLTK